MKVTGASEDVDITFYGKAVKGPKGRHVTFTPHKSVRIGTTIDIANRTSR